MNYLPSAKSPFWQILFAVQLFALIYLLISGDLRIHSDAPSVGVAISLGIVLLAVTFPVTVAFALAAVRKHNKTHPKSRVTLFQVLPPELNDEDERLTGVTARATRNVYLYHNIALPSFALILLFAQPSLPAIVILVGALTVGHYIAYWIGIKPALQD